MFCSREGCSVPAGAHAADSIAVGGHQAPTRNLALLPATTCESCAAAAAAKVRVLSIPEHISNPPTHTLFLNARSTNPPASQVLLPTYTHSATRFCSSLTFPTRSNVLSCFYFPTRLMSRQEVERLLPIWLKLTMINQIRPSISP